MERRFIDTIYKTRRLPPVETKPSPQKSPKIHRKSSGPWLLLGGGFLILITVGIFFTLFWYGLLGEKMALIRIFLGLNGRYLVVFQNNTELRPSGGFIGSFADVELKNGLVKDYYFETNIYKRDKAFAKENCIPYPKPFAQAWKEGCFALKDANWPVDFKRAAQEIMQFYEKEGGRRTKGVIALDTTLFTDLLKIIGPIEMPEYNLTITAENFVKETQYYVEKAYFEKEENKIINEPKSILKDMMPKVLAKLKQPKIAKAVLPILLKHLSEKHLLFFFDDPLLYKIASKNNWTAEVKQNEGDYLYINNANLGGRKSSLNVKQKIKLRSSIQKDGSIINTLTITRIHEGTGEWPDGVNQNYTRVLVPRGSILKDKEGIEEIDFNEEAGKAVFGFWTTVGPGETKTFTISYLLPFAKQQKYTILIQKQPGTLADQFAFVLEGTSQWKWEGVIEKDKIIELNLKKN